MFAGKKPLVVVGSINTDLVAGASRLPRSGETLRAASFAIQQGGKGANQAVAAALLGADVIMIGKVGSDAFGGESLRQLQQRTVDCTHVAVDSCESGVAIITVDTAGENTILVHPGANAAVSSAFIESKRDVIRSAGMVLTQLEIPMASVLHLARICDDEQVPLMLDPAPAQTMPAELLKRITWLTPNETEAAFYAGQDGTSRAPDEVAAKLFQLGVQGVALKLGVKGASVHRTGEQAIQVAPFRVRTVDTTAAGDTFNGAFAAALNVDYSVAEAGRIASAAAAISVTRNGAQASMPTSDELMQFLHDGRLP